MSVSVAAVMLVKDEADIIEATVRHLLAQVDQVLVADNLSTDGTPEILHELERETSGHELIVGIDSELGYYQSRKTSALAARALALGHDWVIPCDADEWWYTWDKTPIRDLLGRRHPVVKAVTATLYNHMPTALDDPAVVSPVERIGWRIRDPGALPKIACRLRPGLVIHQGNHGADLADSAKVTDGLIIRHFPWRSEEQFLRKIRNGEAAYAATDLPEDQGEHWRAFAGKPDEAVLGWFHQWGHSDDPLADPELIYDPAPADG